MIVHFRIYLGPSELATTSESEATCMAVTGERLKKKNNNKKTNRFISCLIHQLVKLQRLVIVYVISPY